MTLPCSKVPLKSTTLLPAVQSIKATYEARYGTQPGAGVYSPDDWMRISYALSRLKPGGTVLEVGIGPGQLLNSMVSSGQFRTVVGVDIRRHSLLLTTSPAMQIQTMSITNLQFPDKHFDSVVCMEVLEHLPYESFVKGLAELRRVCRGQLLVSVPFEEPEPLPEYHLLRFAEDDILRYFPQGQYTLLQRDSFAKFVNRFPSLLKKFPWLVDVPPWLLIEENLATDNLSEKKNPEEKSASPEIPSEMQSAAEAPPQQSPAHTPPATALAAMPPVVPPAAPPASLRSAVAMTPPPIVTASTASPPSPLPQQSPPPSPSPPSPSPAALLQPAAPRSVWGHRESEELNLARLHWLAGQCCGDRVLVIGDGDSELAILLAREGVTVTVLERDPAATARAQQRYAKELPFVQARLRIYNADLAGSPQDEPVPFETVLLTRTLEYQLQPAITLNQALEYLTPAGKLVLVVPVGLDPAIARHQRQEFLASDLKALLQPRCACHSLQAVDGYWRFVGSKDSTGAGWEAYPAEVLLALSEAAIHDTQRRFTRWLAPYLGA